MQMIKIGAWLLLCSLMLSGCARKVPTNAPASTPLPTQSLATAAPENTRFRGTVQSISADTITVQEEETTREFALSENAKADISALRIAAETRVIVNFSTMGEVDTAQSIEKLISELK
ncbi:MAG: hypothetical protein PUB07_02425 [Clostridia bacterium]|nr:hypothetical protein [Clostridia bacterium]